MIPNPKYHRGSPEEWTAEQLLQSLVYHLSEDSDGNFLIDSRNDSAYMAVTAAKELVDPDNFPSESHYFCRREEFEGDKSFSIPFLLTLRGDESLEDRLRSVALDVAGKGSEWDHAIDGAVAEKGRSVIISKKDAITAAQFRTLCEFISSR